MSFLLRDAIHTVLAQTVYNDILSQRSNYYYFIGRVTPWANETTPASLVNTDQEEYITRNNIISIKKIGASDISLVVPRINWISGTVYDQFDGNYSASNPASSGATSLKNAQFYVLTSAFSVYKCLYNNDGAESTVEPSGTDAVPSTYSDGYIWKFLYTIPLSLRNRFLTDSYMPVQKSVNSIFYTDGQIDNITIVNPGSGYTDNANVSLSVVGTFNGGNGNVIANIIPVLNATGQFIDVRIKDRGNNYATASISINDEAGTGIGYYNTLSTANFIPILFNGQLDRVLIDDPGTGYSSNLTTYISTIGDGANVRLTPYINSAGEVEDIIIENPGEGYTYLDIEIIGSGTNANASVNFFTGDLDTVQSTVELSTPAGSLESFIITSGGNNYTSANVTIVGDGTGFQGTVNIDTNTRTVTSITVIDSGANYTHANVVINGNGTGANATAIISPYNGHGFDAEKELFADTLMMYSTINNEKNQGITVNNDFRQFGIIKEIKKFGSNNKFTELLGSACYLITLDSTTGINRDDILYLLTNSNKKFEVVEVYNSKVLVLSKNNYALAEDEILVNTSTEDEFTVQAIDETPDINKFTGDLIFVDNRTSISYSDQQLIALRTTIQL